MKIVTHNSRFHADDVCAAATLLELYPEATITRTRDQDLIEAADIVFDVGNIYNETKLRFDHHQEGGAGVRPDGIPYAAFGLVWKHFGETVCGDKRVADAVEEKFVRSMDAMDNGLELSKPIYEKGPYLYSFVSAVVSFNPTWKENKEDTDRHFFEMVDIARKILRREIQQAKDFLAAEKMVIDSYETADDKRIVVLDRNYPFMSTLISKSEPLYAVLPDSQSTNWKVSAIQTRLMTYEIRKKMPETWAGKRDQDLAEASGVSDAIFCHNGRFLAVAKTKEGALKLARLAVEA